MSSDFSSSNISFMPDNKKKRKKVASKNILLDKKKKSKFIYFPNIHSSKVLNSGG